MDVHAIEITDAELEQWLQDGLRCEIVWNQPKDWHPQEAEWKAIGRCPGCDSRKLLLICSKCKTYLQRTTEMFCSKCSHRATGAAFFNIIPI